MTNIFKLTKANRMADNQLRIGIYGGSFNPVHITHLLISECFRDQMQLDKLLIIPTGISPFKAKFVGEPISVHEAQPRLDMLRLAFAGNPHIEIDEFEIKTRTVCYTIDTLKYIREKYPDAKIFMLIGEDQAEKFDKWKNCEQIREIATICVAGRLGFPHTPPGFIPINSPYTDISSSMVRERVRLRQTIKYIVPDKVAEYIFANGLYKD